MIYYKIKGYPDYRLVRDSKRDFHVESKKKGDWEKIGRKDEAGHIHVTLRGDNVMRDTNLHVIVAELFVPNPENKPIVHHKDFDATNNNPVNLMWVSPSQHREIHNTEEFCRKHSEEMSGNGNPLYGKHHSEESKKKMSERLKGRKPHWLLKPVEQWSKDGTTLIARYESIGEAARQTGINYGNISQCCLGKYKTVGGYRWRYAS